MRIEVVAASITRYEGDEKVFVRAGEVIDVPDSEGQKLIGMHAAVKVDDKPKPAPKAAPADKPQEPKQEA